NEEIDRRLAQLSPSEEQRRAEIEQLRRPRLDENITELPGVTDDAGEIYERGVMWRINTSIPESDLLQGALARVFRDEQGESLLISHSLSLEGIQEVAAAATAQQPPATAPESPAPEAPMSGATESEPAAAENTPAGEPAASDAA